MNYIIDERLLKHYLVRGLPIPYMGLKINQPKISDIDQIGLANFQSYEYIYCANKDYIKFGEDEYINDFDKYTYFQTLFKLKQKDLLHILISSLIFFLKIDIQNIRIFDEECAIVVVDSSTEKPKRIFQLDNDNFEEFSSYIRTICNVEKYKDKVVQKKRKYKNKAMQQKYEELRKNADENQKKKDKENHLDFADIENSVCINKNNTYNYFNVGDLTIWQLYQEFTGSSVIEDIEMVKDRLNSGNFQFKKVPDINWVKKTKIKIPEELRENSDE